MIRIVQDVGAPALVTGIDIATLELAPTWNEWISYGIAGAAYLVSGLNLVRGNGGEFIKNMGIAELPLAARNIYMRVKSPVVPPIDRRAGAGASRLALRRAATNPNPGGGIGRSYQPEFESVGPHAF